MTTRQKNIFACLEPIHADDFFFVILIDGLCQHMSSVVYRFIFKYSLMFALFSKGVLVYSLGHTQFIVSSFQALNIDMIMFEMSYLIYFDRLECI